MAEIVNLRMARKAKARRDKAREADANRALHGDTKHAKVARKMEEARARRELDGAKRERE